MELWTTSHDFTCWWRPWDGAESCRNHSKYIKINHRPTDILYDDTVISGFSSTNSWFLSRTFKPDDQGHYLSPWKQTVGVFQSDRVFLSRWPLTFGCSSGQRDLSLVSSRFLRLMISGLLLGALDWLSLEQLDLVQRSLPQIKPICSALYGPITAVDRGANGTVLASIGSEIRPSRR